MGFRRNFLPRVPMSITKMQFLFEKKKKIFCHGQTFCIETKQKITPHFMSRPKINNKKRWKTGFYVFSKPRQQNNKTNERSVSENHEKKSSRLKGTPKKVLANCIIWTMLSGQVAFLETIPFLGDKERFLLFPCIECLHKKLSQLIDPEILPKYHLVVWTFTCSYTFF